ncbi:MAG: aminotransferase class I/II-fold pyridoxal phosphate-dependent enzyme [Lachnospiraceae bacterium]|nr:aminotransferase class I/II-fold pyridoxal phosphate-dependent enzyme [Lachnospiraceae bacterium]
MKTIHGGDIYRNSVNLDFSVNVNPLGIPEPVKEALCRAVEQCGTYPDIHAEKLKKSVADTHRIPEEHLLFGNGASELFMAVVHALRPKKVVIPVPSFYGYEHAAGAVTDRILYYQLKKENQFLLDEGVFQHLNEDVDMLFIANPNNPTGALSEKAFLIKLAEHCRDKNITVVLDECFIDFCENGQSMADAVSEFENLIIIQAYTKIFTIPGVRLGFMICGNERLREQVRRQLPEWNLSTFAQAAGIACTEQTDFVAKTLEYLNAEREFLVDELGRASENQCIVYPGAANFLMIYSPKPMYEKMLEKGILIRDCGNFRGLGSGYYRIAIKTRQENEQLLKVIGEINWNE